MLFYSVTTILDKHDDNVLSTLTHEFFLVKKKKSVKIAKPSGSSSSIVDHYQKNNIGVSHLPSSRILDLRHTSEKTFPELE